LVVRLGGGPNTVGAGAMAQYSVVLHAWMSRYGSPTAAD
jgi:hypothetical protein